MVGEGLFIHIEIQLSGYGIPPLFCVLHSRRDTVYGDGLDFVIQYGKADIADSLRMFRNISESAAVGILNNAVLFRFARSQDDLFPDLACS